MSPRDVSRHPSGRLLAALLLSAALLSGCLSTTPGNPVASPGAGPTEPSFPKAKPSIPSPNPSQPAPSSGVPPAGAVPLPPDANGRVFIETKSGQTRCQLDSDSVGCEAQFANAPTEDGEKANGVNITAAGEVQWVAGNLGDIPTVPIDYKTYDAVGWTIDASESGTRFTNQHTGHGMFVSIEKVDTY